MLEEEGADWRIDPLKSGEHRAKPHVLRQSFGKMPALTWDGDAPYETQAILHYLDEALPGLRLLNL